MLFDASAEKLPSRTELPEIPGAPKGAAWFWGKDDELGRLNLLTPERTAAAAKTISTGEVVNLNLRADLPHPPLFGRAPFKHHITAILGDSVFDDSYEMNTQSGSQWDGFRHVGHRHDGSVVFYNHVTTDEVRNPKSGSGMEAWANHGIVGRGVLIDYWSYAKKNYDPNTTHRISAQAIKKCAEAQGVEFQYGDILIIRSGFVDVYQDLDFAGREALANKPIPECTFVGVEQTPEMLDFLHDNYFSAVAGDAPAFEAWPTNQTWLCHDSLLCLWGVPIGEMWDLERLTQLCQEKNQYSFYFSSIPTNVAGGVGSYPNAMAIF